MRWDKKIYALYVGDRNICDGTLPQIARKTGRDLNTLRWMTRPAYQRRLAKFKTSNVTILVLIEEDESFEVAE